MLFGMGAVIGAGIFVLTGQEAKLHAGPAVVLSHVISGVSAMLSVFCYTEIAVEIPVAGGSFAYLRVELRDFEAFNAAGNILLEYVIGGAAAARSWTSYFATLCNRDSDSFLIKVHALPHDYNQLDPIAVVVMAVICVLAVLSTKGSSRFNYIASIIHLAVILFIIIGGLTKANSNNYKPFVPFGVRGIFQSSAVPFFAYVGFDAVSTMAEETKNPARDIPIGLVGSMVITTLIYCLLAVTLCLMQPYNEIDELAPFSVAFEAVGWGWEVHCGCWCIKRNEFCLLEQWDKPGSSIGCAVYWGKSDGWIAYTITVPIWLVGTLGLWLLVPQAKKPKVWGVPRVPFLPSASIAINIFLLGSIDKASFIRFGAWTGIPLVYYLFIGLHASYDIAKGYKDKNILGDDGTQLKLDEEKGVDVSSVAQSGTKS
ncbi:Cationic amino acid transporter [Quillaja saponaria]|uniref:Cationic amino acid transporter n=1 Tax=Quillaja saponaria TaxID=32244 RepID=A0AAD7PA71_QUISA|nr:Cationic amino acid transporter [Quillaja saponaria]